MNFALWVNFALKDLANFTQNIHKQKLNLRVRDTDGMNRET